MMMTNESLVELVQCKYDVMKYLRHHLATLNSNFSFTFVLRRTSGKSFPKFPQTFVFCWKVFNCPLACEVFAFFLRSNARKPDCR